MTHRKLGEMAIRLELTDHRNYKFIGCDTLYYVVHSFIRENVTKHLKTYMCTDVASIVIPGYIDPCTFMDSYDLIHIKSPNFQVPVRLNL